MLVKSYSERESAFVSRLALQSAAGLTAVFVVRTPTVPLVSRWREKKEEGIALACVRDNVGGPFAHGRLELVERLGGYSWVAVSF